MAVNEFTAFLFNLGTAIERIIEVPEAFNLCMVHSKQFVVQISGLNTLKFDDFRQRIREDRDPPAFVSIQESNSPSRMIGPPKVESRQNFGPISNLAH